MEEKLKIYITNRKGEGSEEIELKKRVNPLSPNIPMHILLTVLYIFLMLLVGRI